MSKVIHLDKLVIKQFKRINERTIEFEERETDIISTNGKGKTTIADAWSWLLFGKNTQDESVFAIKPLDKYNVPIEKTEPDVTGHIRSNDRPIILRRVLKEVWRTKRGGTTSEFEGNSTQFFIDGAPYNESDYLREIGRLIDYNTFRLITSPTYFNNMPWQARREVLVAMAGGDDNLTIAKSREEFAPLVEILRNKTVAKYKQELTAKKKEIKESLDPIPDRINEVGRMKPDPLDYDVLEAQIKMREEEVAAIEAELADVNKAMEGETEEIRKYQAKIRAVKLEIDQLKDEIRHSEEERRRLTGKELRDKKTRLQTVTRQISDCEGSIDTATRKKQALEKEMNEGREAWKALNATKAPELAEGETLCPMCEQGLPFEKIQGKREEMESNFNQDKAKKLANNVEKGKHLKKSLDETLSLIETRNQEHKILEDEQVELEKAITEMESAPAEDAPDINVLIKSDKQFISLSQKLSDLENNPPEKKDNNTSSKFSRKVEIGRELDEIKKKLNTREQIVKADKRIRELKDQEKDLSQQFADISGKEALVESFTKAKIDFVTASVNGKFQLVKFKMFHQQQNEGVKETCEVLVDGVPYSSLNTASRINAGIDVINALAEHYGARAPIFVDNRESVIELIATNSQVINLIAREGVEEMVITPRMTEVTA